MLLALLLVLPPPTGESSRVLLGASGNFEYTGYSIPGADTTTNVHRVDGAGGVGALILFRPVIDDDAPLGLQVFLQRRSGINLSANGGGFAMTLTDGERHGWDGSFDLDVHGYPGGGALYLFGDVEVDYSSWKDQGPTFSPMSYSEIEIPLRIGIGGRTGDVLIDVNWGIQPLRMNDGSFSVPFWGNAQLRLRAAIDRREWIEGAATVLNGGASVGAAYEYYFDRDLSVGAGARGGHAKYIDVDVPYTFIAIGVDASLWLTTRFGLGLSYAPSWTKADYATGSESRAGHSLTFAISSRL